MFECAVIRFSTHAELWMTGELDFSQEKRAREYWEKTREFAPGTILLDLSNVQFIDLAGFRVLMQCTREALETHTGFAIVTGGNPRFHRPLDQLDGRPDLPLYLSRTDAFHALLRADLLPLVSASTTVSARETGIIRWKFTRGKSLLYAPTALAERFFGNPVPKRVPKPHPLVNWIHEEDRELVLAVHGQAEYEGRCFTIEYRAISPRQELLWLCDVADGWKNGGKAPLRNTVTTEITGRRRPEKDQPPSNATLRTLIDLTPGEVLDLDGDGRSHFARTLLAQLLARDDPGNDLPLLEWTEHPGPSDFGQRLLRILNGAEEHMSVRLHRKDGQEVRGTLSIHPIARPALEVTAPPIEVPEPRPPIAGGDQPPAPQNRELDFWRSQLVHTSDGIFVVDKSGALVEFNGAAEEMSGYTRAQLLGKPFLQLLTPGDRSWVHESIERIWSGESVTFETKLQDPQARSIILSITVVPIMVHAHVMGAFGMMRDITEQKERERECADALTRERGARHQAEQAQQRLHFLSAVSHIAHDSSPPQDKLERVAALALSVLGDFCLVDVVDQLGQLHRVASYHTEPASQERLLSLFANPSEALVPPLTTLAPLAPHFEVRHRRMTEPDLLPEQARVLAEFDSGASLCVPIAGRDGPLGVVTFFRPGTDSLYTGDDRELADELAQILATGIDNIFLYNAQCELAQILQRGLLPPRLPDLPGVLIGTAYHPASAGLEIGGDFYDIFPVADGGWAAIIGDVTGKGPAAATVTGLVRHTLRALTPQIQEPSRLLAAANNVLTEQLSGEHFCSLTFVHFSWQHGELRARIASAGHLPTLVLRQSGELEILELPGMLIGVFPELTWGEQSIAFGPGDTLILYTDGVTDARAGRQRFGEETLQELIRGCSGLSAPQIAQRIETTVAQFCEGDPVDDIAVLVIQLPPPHPLSP